jgi:hypothetical protein
MDTPLLASELISALSNPKRGIENYVNGKYAKAMTRNIQVEVVKSQKFVLTNNLLHHAVVGSYLPPKDLLNATANAIPPFNNMWIEWDEHKRVEYGRKEIVKLVGEDKIAPLDLVEIPSKIGYHIQKVDGEFLYACYYKSSQGCFRSPEMGFDIHNEVYTYEKYVNQWKKHNGNNPNVISEKSYHKEVFQQGRVLLSQPYCDYYKEKDKTSLATLMTHLSPTQTAATHWTRTAEEFDRPMTSADAFHHGRELSLITGDARFLLSLLNILNYDLIVTENRTPPKQIEHISLGRKVPKNEYKLVEINLPKPRGKKVYKQIFSGHGSPKREHWRRGHWRRVNDVKGNFVKRIWIEEQKVGNPEYGSIIHDYVLKKK